MIMVVMIDKCGIVGGMRVGKETEILGEVPPHCRFVHHESHVT
jgi:hypothetical protein